MKSSVRGARIALHLAMMAPLLLACGGDQFIELPEVPGSKTVAAFLRRQGTVAAEARRAFEPFRFERPSSERIELTLAFYPESLEELGLEPGPLVAGTDASCRPGTFGDPLESFSTDLESSDLEALSETPEFVKGFRFELPCPCVDLSWRAVPLPQVDGIANVAPAGPSSIFYLIAGKALVELDLETGVESRVALDESEGYTHLCSAEAGTVYLAGLEGDFARYSRAGGLERLPPFPASAETETAGLVCRRRGETSEVLLLRTPEAVLLSFRGGEWSVAYSIPPSAGRTGNRGELIQRRDGTIFLVPEDGASLIDLDAEFREIETTVWNRDLDLETGPFGGAAESTDLGLVMFTRLYHLLHRPSLGREWAPIADDRRAVEPSPWGILSYRGGALTFGAAGSLREVHPEVGLCPPETTLEQLELERATILQPSGQLVIAPSEIIGAGEGALIVLSPGP